MDRAATTGIKPIFSFFFSDTENKYGVMTLGGWNETYFAKGSQITWLPTDGNKYVWATKMGEIKLGD